MSLERHVVLKWLAADFAADKKYSEKEVNKIIGRHHPDFATVRRERVGAKLLDRANGVCWKL